MLDHINISIWVKVLWVRELLGEGGSSQNVFHDLNIPMFKLSDVQQCFNSFNELLFAKLVQDLISSGYFQVLRLDGVEQLCCWRDGSDFEGLDDMILDSL